MTDDDRSFPGYEWYKKELIFFGFPGAYRKQGNEAKIIWLASVFSG